MKGTERFRALARGLASTTLAGWLVAACQPAGGTANAPGSSVPPIVEPTVRPGFAAGQRIELVPGIPGDVQAAELTGDGLVDLVQTNFVARKLTIAAGVPDGSFATAFQFDTVSHPWRSTVGDFDGDGLEDIATICVARGSGDPAAIYIFRQSPAGVFQTSTSIEVDSDGTFLTAGPIDGVPGPGARDEVFVAFPDTREVGRFRLDGAGQVFEAGTLDSAMLPATGRPFSVAMLDWRGDGALDFVVGEIEVDRGELDRIILYPRTSAGDLGAPFPLIEPAWRPIISAAGDIDGNGFDDLAIAQFEGEQALLALMDENGPAWLQAFYFGGPTTSLALVDVDEDGDDDLLGSVFFGSAISVRLNEGSALPQAPVAFSEPTYHYGGYLPRALAPVRVPDGEGGDRVGVVMSTAFDIGLLPIDAGEFLGPVGFETDRRGPIGVEAADLDGDGNQDAISLSVDQEAVTFWRGGGDGTLELVRSDPMVPSREDAPGALATGDMDGDGRADGVVSVYGGDEIRIYGTTGQIEDLVQRSFPAPGGPRGVEVLDADGDGDLDVAAALTLGGALRIFVNDGTGDLLGGDPQPLSPAPVALLATDLDVDGDADLALTSSSSAAELGGKNALLILGGDGTGAFDERARLALESFSTDVATADFDRDGLPDLVVGQAGPTIQNVLLALSDGDLEFSPREILIGDFPKNVTPTDLDGNGAVDLLVASSTGDLRLAFGDGTGEFPNIEPARADGRGFPVLYQVQDVAWSDLDGDGLNDFLMVAPESPFVWVLPNRSEPIERR